LQGRATLLHTTCGTPNYVAPEVLNDKGYGARQSLAGACGALLFFSSLRGGTLLRALTPPASLPPPCAPLQTGARRTCGRAA
jgi:hypothetical protein